MPGRKEMQGGAGILTLTSGITALSTSLQADGSVAGWPTGATYPFVIKIDPTGNEEKCLCDSLTGASPCTININTRGYDGTSAIVHAANVRVQHCIDADSLDTLFAHEFDTTRDDHTQYVPTDGSRGFSDVSAVAGSPVSLGFANADGVALDFARSDHVHRLPANTRPVFVVADSAALLALTPNPGDLAYKLDDKRWYSYRVTQWGLAENQIAQGDVTGGPTSGGTELTIGTLVIAAIPATYQLECAAFWSPSYSVTDDLFLMRIKVDGVEKGSQVVRSAAINSQIPFSIPTSTLTTIAVNTSSTVTVTIQRTAGTGVATEVRPGKITARLWPL